MADDKQGMADKPIGHILRVAGSGVRVRLDAKVSGGSLAIAQGCQAGQPGGLIKIRVGGDWLYASITAAQMPLSDAPYCLVDAELLGEIPGSDHCGRAGFRRGISCYPSPGSLVHAATLEDNVAIYGCGEEGKVAIGTIFATKGRKGHLLIDTFLSRHFALLGSTGTGKSTAMALIVRRICTHRPQGHVIMIDPHGEYAAAFKDLAEIWDTTNLRMPYWLMNLDEHCDVLAARAENDREIDKDILSKCLSIVRRNAPSADACQRITPDSPLPYALSDLSGLLQAEMSRLEKPTENAPYLRLKSRLDELRHDPRYAFMFSGMLVSDTMAEFLSRILRIPQRNKPISIIDLSGVPSEITSVVVGILSRLVLDFATWTRSEERRPILLVCEEAHRYIPAEPAFGSPSSAKVFQRIAKEGRKYGVALGLVSQRPSDLSETVLSQCGTVMAMRLPNARDQAFVRAALPDGGHSLLAALPALRNRECIISGEGVSLPMRLMIDDLDVRWQPNSADPAFSNTWGCKDERSTVITDALQRWRHQSV